MRRYSALTCFHVSKATRSAPEPNRNSAFTVPFKSYFTSGAHRDQSDLKKGAQVSPSVRPPPQRLPEHHYFPPGKALGEEDENPLEKKNTIWRYKSSVRGEETGNTSSPISDLTTDLPQLLLGFSLEIMTGHQMQASSSDCKAPVGRG